MRKIMKRGFCLFLVAVLLAGLVPYAFADEAKPTDVSEDAAEPTEETTAPPETTVPSESTEPPSEPTEPTATTEATEPEADPVEDDTEDDRLLPDNISTYASTVSNVLLFDQASPNYTTVLSSQISVTYQPNGTDTAKTAYIKNLGWHFARYNNTPYEDDPIYCIEPCKNYAASTSGNYMDQDLGVSGSGSSRGSNVWYAMPSSYRQAIALTLLYSKQLWNSNYSVKTTAMANNPNVSTRIATQFLIYEIVTGLRDASTFNRKSSNGYSSGDVFYNAGVANVSGFAGKYNSIVSSVQNAMKVPSFTSRSSGSAPTITMSGSQVSVTDSNGVLGNFSFANGNGASFSKSGNTLTITKTGTISPSTVFSATRSLPSAENSTVSIYYSASSTYQTCVKLYSPQVETQRAYFKINAPNPGAIALVKTTEDGQNLSGWRFGVYSNTACTTLVSDPHTTDSNGKISVTGLNAGTYYVKELGHSDSSISSRYTCSGDNPQKVSVSNGATATVSFYNRLAVGALEIRKSTNTDNHLGGWKFIVKKDGAEIPGSPFTTDETGIIRISNAGVTVAFFTDAACTDKVATWSQDSGKFTVTYSEDGRHMTVDITKAGLDEINGSTANKNGKLYTGYSNYTARVTYSAVINSDNSFAYGEKGNENTVILSWKRTSGDYYDTLIDDCHVFSFGLDLTKLFSDVDAETAAETKLYDSVKFKIQNKTDGIWIIAKRNDAEGVYYVTGHTDKETDATVFTPVTMGKAYGHIMVKGLEEDTYTITETQTANGYTLLKNAITVTISLKENTANTCNVYAKDVLGVLQNDPHYSFDGGEDLKLTNIPQRALSHNYPTVSATVDKNDVTMLEDNGSANAEVPLTVKNTKGFDLPKTGDHGTWMYSLVGILLMSTAAGVIVLTVKKKHGR